MCSALSAAKRSSSVRGSFGSPSHSSKSLRISVPRGVPPGSLVVLCGMFWSARLRSSFVRRVVLPHPFIPSNTTNGAGALRVNVEGSIIMAYTFIFVADLQKYPALYSPL